MAFPRDVPRSVSVSAVPDSSGSAAPVPWYRSRLFIASMLALLTFIGVVGTMARERSQTQAQVTELAAPESPAGLVLATQGEKTSLASVGRTQGLAQPCTAWLLGTGAPATAPAVAVTAGRCVGAEPYEVLSGVALHGATVDFHAFAPVSSAGDPGLVTAKATTVLWASTRWSDLALLQLDSTYGELDAAGIKPVAPVATPAQGTKVLAASVSVTGIPVDQQYTRATTCAVGANVGTLAGPTLLTDQRATDCHGLLGGSEGAPVFNPAGAAVAMVTGSTVAAQDAASCGPTTPCEVAAGKVATRANTTYVQPVAGLLECWDAGRLKLGGSCPLEDPGTVTPAEADAAAGAPGSTVTLALAPRVESPRRIASVTGTVGATDCRAAAGWSDPVAAEDWKLTLTLPEQGWGLACAGSPEQPTPVVVAVTGAQAAAAS